MSASEKPVMQESVVQQATPPASELPSSPGDSPRQMTPKDITPEHASWRDLHARDITIAHSTDCEEKLAARQENIAARQPRAVHPSMPASEALPSSHGKSPVEVTPKDITPDDAAWSDIKTRDIAVGETVEREEAMIDESIELTFPASDPSAELPASPESVRTLHCQDEQENLLDEAIELTFPASDPIAVSRRDRVEVHAD